MFDVGLGEMLVLVVLALVIFGDRLPQAAQQAGRTLRQIRQMANSARADLQEGLGPEFKDFDVADLNPKNFVRKHLLEDHDEQLSPDVDPNPRASANGGILDDGSSYATTPGGLAHDERPPFDSEAT